MQSTFTMDQLSQARGLDVLDSAGEKIGQVEEVFYDQQTGQPEWIGIGTGFFGTKRILVPVVGADLRQDGLYVPYSKEQVKESPDIDADEIDQETEAQLASFYGIGYSEERSETGLPEPRGRSADQAVTRHEEELAVGKRDVEAGRVRLRKWVETEPVEADVQLRRETARVTREPVDQPVSGAEIGDEEIEVALRAEEPVVEKRAVAKERVGLETDVETEQRTVGGEVRKERVDVEDEPDRPGAA